MCHKVPLCDSHGLAEAMESPLRHTSLAAADRFFADEFCRRSCLSLSHTKSGFPSKCLQHYIYAASSKASGHSLSLCND